MWVVGPDAWLVAGLGVALWLGGELYWTLALADSDSPPTPSLSDPLYLAFYVASYVTLLLLIRSRLAALRPSLWLDGAIAALAVAALVAALGFQPILEETSGDGAAVATNLAYPIADLVLLGLVVVACGLSGWRPDRGWQLIGAGFAVSALADGIYLVQEARGVYSEGTLLDALWPAAALMVGLAAWQPARRATARLESWRVVIAPFLAAMVAVTLLAYDHFSHLNDVALALSTTTLVAVTVRMALAFVENQRMVARSREEARTDALTGLLNRRSLMLDLEHELATATPSNRVAVVLFDLDGFKHYNDAYGHPAGDALLARLGGRLAAAVTGRARAYRLGGDEFCVVLPLDGASAAPLVARLAVVLSEHGKGFSVEPSYGVVIAPDETAVPNEALGLADRRMYVQKGSRRTSAGRQTRDVLLSTLRERQPELHAHLTGVARLALALGRELGMTPEELDELGRAAELHDVGKVAIPDAILSKPGPLDDAEWSFMRRHTIIAERILGAAPALRPVAKLVRSSHERFDGAGYPDGLAGEAIPLGARVVAVCDAFHAMTSDRPYRRAVSPETAVEELRRCAGSQFDPAVVQAFGGVPWEGAALDDLTRA